MTPDSNAMVKLRVRSSIPVARKHMNVMTSECQPLGIFRNQSLYPGVDSPPWMGVNRTDETYEDWVPPPLKPQRTRDIA